MPDIYDYENTYNSYISKIATATEEKKFTLLTNQIENQIKAIQSDNDLEPQQKKEQESQYNKLFEYIDIRKKALKKHEEHLTDFTSKANSLNKTISDLDIQANIDPTFSIKIVMVDILKNIADGNSQFAQKDIQRKYPNIKLENLPKLLALQDNYIAFRIATRQIIADRKTNFKIDENTIIETDLLSVNMPSPFDTADESKFIGNKQSITGDDHLHDKKTPTIENNLISYLMLTDKLNCSNLSFESESNIRLLNSLLKGEENNSTNAGFLTEFKNGRNNIDWGKNDFHETALKILLFDEIQDDKIDKLLFKKIIDERSRQILAKQFKGYPYLYELISKNPAINLGAGQKELNVLNTAIVRLVTGKDNLETFVNTFKNLTHYELSTPEKEKINNELSPLNTQKAAKSIQDLHAIKIHFDSKNSILPVARNWVLNKIQEIIFAKFGGKQESVADIPFLSVQELDHIKNDLTILKNINLNTNLSSKRLPVEKESLDLLKKTKHSAIKLVLNCITALEQKCDRVTNQAELETVQEKLQELKKTFDNNILDFFGKNGLNIRKKLDYLETNIKALNKKLAPAQNRAGHDNLESEQQSKAKTPDFFQKIKGKFTHQQFREALNGAKPEDPNQNRTSEISTQKTSFGKTPG